MSFSTLDSPLLGGLMTTPEMAALFSESNRIAAMLKVEAAHTACVGDGSIVQRLVRTQRP